MRVLVLAVLLMTPHFAAAAAIDHLGYTTDPQTVAPATVSGQITIETQDAASSAVNGNSVCLIITSSSATAEFSTNESSWPSEPNRTLSLTQSTSQYRRNFYYRDGTAGSYTLTAKAGLRPGTSCTGWTAESATWTASQTITIGSGSSAGQQSSQETSTTTSSTTSSSSSIIVPSYVPPPAAEIFADAGESRTVIVGADTEFRGRAYNRDQEFVEGVRFLWNFGDGTIAEGSLVYHHFAYPGTYAVILDIAQHVSAASEKILVTAVPAELGFVVHSDGSVAIANESGRDIDISRWLIRSFGRTFAFPEGTIILEGQTLRLSHTVLGFTVSTDTELLYPNGVRAELIGTAAKAVAPIVTTLGAPAQKTIAPVSATAAAALPHTEDLGREAETPMATSSLVAAAGTVPSSGKLWWFAAIGLALGTCAIVYLVRRTTNGEWDIIDESA